MVSTGGFACKDKEELLILRDPRSGFQRFSDTVHSKNFTYFGKDKGKEGCATVEFILLAAYA